MGIRKPRLTKKRADGMYVAIGLLEGCLVDFEPGEDDREELMTAIEYLRDLWGWYQDKHDWPHLNEGGE
tara:strand:- start:32 stop:238 length:207 start_codon:yes stop_codon:yes gene_type:complete